VWGSVMLVNVATSSQHAQDTLAICLLAGHSKTSLKLPPAKASRARTQSVAFRLCFAAHTRVVLTGSLTHQRPKLFAQIGHAQTARVASRSASHSLVAQASRVTLPPLSVLGSALPLSVA